jgi:predicted NAD/FAD-binding protein
MRAFPRLSTLYEAWKSFVEEQSQGSVRIVTNHEVTRVQRSSRERGGVEAWSRPTQGTDNNQNVVDPGEEAYETYDEIVFCTDADAALKILGNGATWLEKRVLGNVKVRQVNLTPNDERRITRYVLVSVGHDSDT